MQSDRRRELIRILRSHSASSQGDIVAQLKAAGHAATQATISRDLQAIGALKVHVDSGHVYRLPDEVPRAGGDLMVRNLARTLDEFALELKAAGNVVVIRTAPGHAAAVARSIDLTDNDEIVGTIAGDDTIFVATPDVLAAQRVIQRWRRSNGGISNE